MSSIVKTEVHINSKRIQRKLNQLCSDDATMYEIHNLFAKTIDPWTPFREGPLSQSVRITPQYIQYIVPYAHYQYEGININEANRTRTIHPLATSHWDKVAMQTQRDSFVRQVQRILKRRARQLYGWGWSFR